MSWLLNVVNWFLLLLILISWFSEIDFLFHLHVLGKTDRSYWYYAEKYFIRKSSASHKAGGIPQSWKTWMLAVVLGNSFAADRGMICTAAWCCSTQILNSVSIHSAALTGHRSTGEVVGNVVGNGMLLGMLLAMHWAGQVWPSAILGFLAPLGHGVSDPSGCWDTTALLLQPKALSPLSHLQLSPVFLQPPAFPGFRTPGVPCSFCVLTNPRKDLCPTSSSQPPCMSLLAPTTFSDRAFQHFALKWVWKWHSLVSKQKFGDRKSVV